MVLSPSWSVSISTSGIFVNFEVFYLGKINGSQFEMLKVKAKKKIRMTGVFQTNVCPLNAKATLKQNTR